MKNHLSNDPNVLANEIDDYKQQAGVAIYEIGIRQIGKRASLKQIANHVAPQLDIDRKYAYQMLILAKGGANDE